MPRTKKALILFAKVPRPGYVKTRLRPILSPDQAAELYAAFVYDLLRATGRLTGVTRIISCDPTARDPFFRALANRYQLRLMDQYGANLGERMRNAMAEAHRQGFGRVVIIGTDCPTLPMEFVRQAFRLLSTHEVVLGPSRDGGYYLIGCRRCIPQIFKGIPWGTDRVLALTFKKITDLQLKCALLPLWYDVDTMKDIRFLVAHLNYLEQQGEEIPAPNTTRVIKTLKNDKMVAPRYRDMIFYNKGGVPKWLREQSAKLRCSGSNPLAASTLY